MFQWQRFDRNKVLQRFASGQHIQSACILRLTAPVLTVISPCVLCMTSCDKTMLYNCVTLTFAIYVAENIAVDFVSLLNLSVHHSQCSYSLQISSIFLSLRFASCLEAVEFIVSTLTCIHSKQNLFCTNFASCESGMVYFLVSRYINRHSWLI